MAEGVSKELEGRLRSEIGKADALVGENGGKYIPIILPSGRVIINNQ
jgi:hypothetical protein